MRLIRDLIKIIIIIALVVLAWQLYMYFFGPIQNSVSARARVIDVWDTKTTINEDPVAGLRLEVFPDNGDPSFQIEVKKVVSRLQVSLVRPGVWLKIKYDPERPQRIDIFTICAQNCS